MHVAPVTIDHKTFRLEVPAIDLADGEILGIFGKSGAGKTSYLKRIRESMDPRDVHYMSQFDGLLEEITVRQNIELGIAAGGKTFAKAHNWEKEHEPLLKAFEVDKHIHKYPRAMSGGQRKRAEIVRSLIMNPRMLLLDEPFTGIGHLFETVCTREILKRSERKEGNTIIVSHDVDLLATFSNRIMLVDDHGVIGFVPTRDSAWHPENVRTAWTLGVDNVLPGDAIRLLQTNALPSVSDDQSLGFWGYSAMWNGKAESSITIPRSMVRSVRTSMKQGTVYTRVEIDTPGQEASMILVGEGHISNDGDPLLAIHSSWVLNS